MERTVSLSRSRHTIQFGSGLVLAALSGGLLLLAFPPHDVGILAWFALVPSILAQFLLAPNDRAARLYMATTYVVGICLVVVSAFPADLVPAPIPLTLPIAVATLLLGGLLFFLGLPTGTPSFHRRTRFRFFVLGPAVTWVGFEFLRMLAQLGHVWGLLVTSQHDNLPLCQLAALGGPWLPSLLIVATNYALGLVGIALGSSPDGPVARRPAAWSVAILALLLAGALAWGGAHSRPPADTVRVAAIQPGEELGDVGRYVGRWSSRDWPALSREIIPDMAGPTRTAAARGAELIVWPEATIWLDPRTDPWTREELANLAQETAAYLVVPYFILPPEGNLSWWLGFAPGMRNEAVVVTPRGDLLGPYAKSHPIPFIGERSSTRGHYPVHPLPLSQVGTMLGYDTAFTDTARRLTRRGAQLLTLSTHDWPSMSPTYGAHTCLRAVENGVAVVKADWEVGSLIVDPFGRVVAAAPDDHPTEMIVIADVALLPPGGTLYTKTGDLLGYICLGGMVLFLALARFSPLSRAVGA